MPAPSVAARLDAVRGQLDSVVTWSESQMAREETSGGSCGTSSGAGRGPLYNARVGVRDQITSLRDGVHELVARAGAGRRRAAAAERRRSCSGATVEERQQSFERHGVRHPRRARATSPRAPTSSASRPPPRCAPSPPPFPSPPGQSGFSCYDPTLAQRLTQAAAQAEQPAELKLREAAFNEGPAGVANAVKNLWSNIGAYLSSLVGYVSSGGKPAAATHRHRRADHRPRYDRAARHHRHRPRPAGAGDPQSAAAGEQAAVVGGHPPDQRGHRTPPSRAPGADIEWVRRHFIHHNGASYLVIPNLYSCDPKNEDECAKALAMNQLAGVLDDLDLVRWPQRPRWWTLRKGELDKLKAEEKRRPATRTSARSARSGSRGIARSQTT